MFTVEIIGENIDETQQWWQNFIDHFCDTIGADIPETSYDKLLTKELKKHKAKMIINNTTNDLDALEFDDEKHYTAFLLKWS